MPNKRVGRRRIYDGWDLLGDVSTRDSFLPLPSPGARAAARRPEGVYYACDSEQSEERLAEFLESVQLVGLDEETARIFGRQRGRLRAEGLLIGDTDLLIAATALQYNLTLLSNNRRHFERIEGLRIESV